MDHSTPPDFKPPAAHDIDLAPFIDLTPDELLDVLSAMGYSVAVWAIVTMRIAQARASAQRLVETNWPTPPVPAPPTWRALLGNLDEK